LTDQRRTFSVDDAHTKIRGVNDGSNQSTANTHRVHRHSLIIGEFEGSTLHCGARLVVQMRAQRVIAEHASCRCCGWSRYEGFNASLQSTPRCSIIGVIDQVLFASFAWVPGTFDIAAERDINSLLDACQCRADHFSMRCRRVLVAVRRSMRCRRACRTSTIVGEGSTRHCGARLGALMLLRPYK